MDTDDIDFFLRRQSCCLALVDRSDFVMGRKTTETCFLEIYWPFVRSKLEFSFAGVTCKQIRYRKDIRQIHFNNSVGNMTVIRNVI